LLVDKAKSASIKVEVNNNLVYLRGIRVEQNLGGATACVDVFFVIEISDLRCTEIGCYEKLRLGMLRCIQLKQFKDLSFLQSLGDRSGLHNS
jgi:hypothetical protein